MDRYFVCLANSYKRGGRCVAGVEVVCRDGSFFIVRDNDGRPRWIRPVARTQFGEIPNFVAASVKLCSLVKLTETIPYPEGAHTENVLYSRLEVCKNPIYPSSQLLAKFTDPIHQAVFLTRGKAIPSQMLTSLNHSLMLIHVKNAHAYIDDNREKSKNRMFFTYYDTDYDLPITDPSFLELLQSNPDSFTTIPSVYLVLSLGLEFEGWHHKLVAGVFVISDVDVQNDAEVKGEWYEQELTRLLEQKRMIDEQISELRKRLQKQMETRNVKVVNMQQYSVTYVPAKTVMQFDSRSFRVENEELYARYCKPKQKDASIVVRRKT